MRSSTAPILVILALASIVLLLFVLLQTIGLRGELDATRDELTTLQAAVEGVERGVPMSELSMRLAELENDIESWVIAFSGDLPSGSTGDGSAGTAALLDRLDEILERINALDARVDEICDGVPVC